MAENKEKISLDGPVTTELLQRAADRLDQVQDQKPSRERDVEETRLLKFIYAHAPI